MRAFLLLIALLAPAAAAQDGQTSPSPDGTVTPLRYDEDHCNAPASMPTPFDADPGAASVEVERTGPEPVAMPNLCGPSAALAAAPSGVRRLPMLDFDDFQSAPPAVRERFLPPYSRPQRRAVPEIDPEGLKRYLENLPEGTDAFDLLAPDAPVAPPRDRE